MAKNVKEKVEKAEQVEEAKEQVANADAPEVAENVVDDLVADEVIVPKTVVGQTLVLVRVCKDIPNLYIAGARYSGSINQNIRVPDFVAEDLRANGYIQ